MNHLRGRGGGVNATEVVNQGSVAVDVVSNSYSSYNSIYSDSYRRPSYINRRNNKDGFVVIGSSGSSSSSSSSSSGCRNFSSISRLGCSRCSVEAGARVAAGLYV